MQGIKQETGLLMASPKAAEAREVEKRRAKWGWKSTAREASMREVVIDWQSNPLVSRQINRVAVGFGVGCICRSVNDQEEREA